MLFLTSPALFYQVQALFCRKQACFDMRVPYVGTTMTRRGAFQNDSTPFVLLLKFFMGHIESVPPKPLSMPLWRRFVIQTLSGM
ncbi:Uncharacterised protein [Pantoea agglomerans]|uniref:Uncharacterized protein n=1 Tax=Enterobacter agglomerans TaxID=549 RepID=A0A379AMA0_ENTAG|nr:Uncharacterised protein [Pantoea agglomerans]